MKAIIAEEGAKVEELLLISLSILFWEQQIKAAECKSSKPMRWHPVMIKWCLYKPSGAYEALRNSGCIFLPSQRTLRGYTHCFEGTVGFSNNVDQMLMDVAKMSKLQDWKKIVGILVDEMYVLEDLVYLVVFQICGNQ